ncbi:capsule assembly Wzi family protein [Echinicola vietnamensis]|uniref:Capsule assembly protein Wzi n=1 Tax=Echinicola vietnamensis (strain DSM 17526 / LMG 23754 / KMM 6221) TaxID=926556 RepID=L0G5A4_ECHVK|nr:capsule assembly Wzi family protein [Echinicola vietnamensis]AGA79995.1 hypothetical protein Echvi_3783 [Echinicola vietnamensis DSM 17526]
MFTNLKKGIGAMLVFASMAYSAKAQSTNLNAPFLKEYLRRQQLIGNFNPNYSLTILPLTPEVTDLQVTGHKKNGWYEELYGQKRALSFGRGKGSIKMLPEMVRGQYNSDYAFGVNDGAMIPNAGLQTLISAGFYVRYGALSLQFQPELLTAQNLPYEGFPQQHWGSTWDQYYEWLNTTDIVERFGPYAYVEYLLGQSHLKYHYKDLAIGISTESIWWGPGRRNSLLMSNNAPGFLHATLETTKPIETNIGRFEGQLIAGKLRNSGYLPPGSDYTFRQTPLYIPKRDEDERYLAGIIVNYQPKWLPGLTLGYSSVSQMYRADMDSFGDYLPIFNGAKRPANVVDLDAEQRNQLSAGFFRWASPGKLFEFYGEYGTNGNSKTFREMFMYPDLNRAFTLGFTKYIQLKDPSTFLGVQLETTQTGQSVRENILAKESWYTHPYVRHGYTNNGQVMGAGNGPGSNVIFAEVSWNRNFTKLGIQMERIVYNNDFYYKRFEEIKDWRRKYVDLVPSFVAEWQVYRFLVSAKFQYVKTLNYKWYLENSTDGTYWVPGLDKDNMVGHFSLMYLLK